MLRIMRRDAVTGDDDIIVPLISIDCSHSHARMRVYPGDDDDVWPDLRKPRVEISAEECAVALLHDHGIFRESLELWQQITARSARDGDRRVAGAHVERRIVKIRCELLSN